MKVYVIMGNDYPEAVFRHKDEADAYVQLKKDEQVEHKKLGHGNIYWRSYEFELRE